MAEWPGCRGQTSLEPNVAKSVPFTELGDCIYAALRVLQTSNPNFPSSTSA